MLCRLMRLQGSFLELEQQCCGLYAFLQYIQRGLAKQGIQTLRGCWELKQEDASD